MTCAEAKADYRFGAVLSNVIACGIYCLRESKEKKVTKQKWIIKDQLQILTEFNK